MADFEAVNIKGTKNVLDAAEAVDLRRVVAVSTGTFFDTGGGLDREDAPVTMGPSQDPYTLTKMAAFNDAMARADQGQGRREHASRGHLRALAGGQQCPREDQLQPGPALAPPVGASSAT